MWGVKYGETLFELFVFVANGNAGFCQEGGTLGLLVYF